MNRIMGTVFLAAAALAAPGMAAHAAAGDQGGAANWPDKPIRLVLPFPPGGGTDALARIMAPKLAAELGQSVIVDNRTGASGNIATEYVAKAPPDGYTVLMGFNTTLTMNPALFKNMPVNVEKDLRPVIKLAQAQYVLVVNSQLPVHSVDELVKLAKSEPGKLNFSSSGAGSPLHMSAEVFMDRTGTNMAHIPYRGGGPAMLAVLGGQAQLIFGSVTAVEPHVKEGKLTALATTGLKRSPNLPNVPTLDELGLKGFDVTSWYGLLVPAKTPQPIVIKLQNATEKVMKDPEVLKAMDKQGLEPAIVTGPAFAKNIDEETKMWAALVKKLNLKID
jgi:tripartite-type tricarboxylate transporter receptor subunit TctC